MRWIALLLLLNSIVTTTQAEQEKENWIFLLKNEIKIPDYLEVELK